MSASEFPWLPGDATLRLTSWRGLWVSELMRATSGHPPAAHPPPTRTTGSFHRPLRIDGARPRGARAGGHPWSAYAWPRIPRGTHTMTLRERLESTRAAKPIARPAGCRS